MRRKDREVTDMNEIGKILDLCKTCHVAMQDEKELYLVPLSYGYELKEGWLTLYFHSAFKKESPVSFSIPKIFSLSSMTIPLATIHAIP